MARTSEGKVKEILGDDYDSLTPRSLRPFVTGAGLITDRLSVAATAADEAITAAELTEVEGWVAAYLYTKSDRLYTSRSTLGASGSWLLKENPYLEGAKALDPTGLLASVLSTQRADGFWIGKDLPERLSYDDRNGGL